jgi:hypothetical protein
MRSRVAVIDLLAFNYYRFSMDELAPIEIRIRKLVEDFFANRITGHEFKLELDRMREEFEVDEETIRKPRRRKATENLLPDQGESSQPAYPES